MYVIGTIFALYLNFVVLIVQSFQKVPALHDLAPNQNEPPFLVVQVASMVAFFVLGTARLEAIPCVTYRDGSTTKSLLPGDQP